jgi:hypothetical protein
MMPKRESNRVVVTHRRCEDDPAVVELTWPPDGLVLHGRCKRCGMAGAHRTAMECIDALRDKLAEYE